MVTMFSEYCEKPFTWVWISKQRDMTFGPCVKNNCYSYFSVSLSVEAVEVVHPNGKTHMYPVSTALGDLCVLRESASFTQTLLRVTLLSFPAVAACAGSEVWCKIPAWHFLYISESEPPPTPWKITPASPCLGKSFWRSIELWWG